PAATLTPPDHFKHNKSHQYPQSSVPRVHKHPEFSPSPLQHTQDMNNKTRRPRPGPIIPSAATPTPRSSDVVDMDDRYQRMINTNDLEPLALANPFIFPKKKTAPPGSDSTTSPSKVSLTEEALKEIHDVVKDAAADSTSHHILAGIKADIINLVRRDDHMERLIEQTSERIVIETYANIGMAINQIDQRMSAKLDKMETILTKRLAKLGGEVDRTRQQLVKEELEWEDLREGLEDLDKEVVGLKERLDNIPWKIVDELKDRGWVVADPGSLVLGG
ncbi:hypothetical protein V8F33_009358, partial [Rhypophila sp. PSN 637]